MSDGGRKNNYEQEIKANLRPEELSETLCWSPAFGGV